MENIKEVTVVDYLDFYYPNYDFEGVVCSCHKLLIFKKEERQPYETIKIICPNCGCQIIYG
jgi:hypothetical protein